MIKAVLLDLDDTLIATRIDTFFPLYLRELGEYSSRFAPPEEFIERLMGAFYKTIRAYEPSDPLYPRLMRHLTSAFGIDEAALDLHFDAFYGERYGALRGNIQPRAGSLRLLDLLFERGIQVVVATNPGLPYAAISQRMAWGGIPPERYNFALITSLEEMHFGKPYAEYYAEIAARLDVEPGEALMVGDDWGNDIVGAAEAGLHTYWVTPGNAQPPLGDVPLDGCGTYEQFIDAVDAGWLDTLICEDSGRTALIHRLAAYPAAVDAVRRPHPRAVLECCPGEAEWSSRDVVCHLCEHEREERTRLQRILTESNPFLSANASSQAAGGRYQDMAFEEAFKSWVEHRADTLAWLRSIPAEDWVRPARDAIFGPTYFQEMVGFMAEHDRTHLHQMQDAIAYALTACEGEA